ncbi:MAG: hypothetical protein EAZ37_09570 [Burkholderiales bacterium]|nr:MAG: hypothetical protein EAZ37_09570 [Burkholderiales bacterium]
MTILYPDNRGWYKLDGTNPAESIRAIGSVQHIEKLSITNFRLLTVELAKQFSSFRSVGWMWLWCDVTRSAMRHVIRIPGLEVLDVLNIKAPGKLQGFDSAENLHTVRANHYLKEEDVLAITQCRTLQELGIQGAEVTPKVIAALLSLTELRALDVEGSAFDDRMAASLCELPTLEVLDVGGTNVSRAGLTHLISMKQLRSLDLWATKVTEADLELLRELPGLEYISVGNYEGLLSLDANKVVPLLLELPSLKRVWLDGISVSDTQKAALHAKLDSVRITSLQSDDA